MSPRPTSISSSSTTDTLAGAAASREVAARPAHARHAAAGAGGQHDDLVAGAQRARGQAARVVALALVADHVLDRQPRRAVGGAGVLGRALEVGEQRLARVPGHRLRAVDDVVAVQRADGDEGDVAEPGAGGELRNSRTTGRSARP